MFLDAIKYVKVQTSLNDMSKLLTQYLLLINRSSIWYNEIGKKETLSRSYFFLAHNPLVLDGEDLVHLKMNVVLDCMHYLVHVEEIAYQGQLGRLTVSD
jgi:hypothetical protein